MEVTKSNFREVLPKVKKSIDDSCFLAIDCEMTGLDSGAKINIFDTHKSYYEKIKRGSQNFIVVQFGLATFAFDHENQVFKPSYYNFYIFPRQHDRSSPDRRFLCQASSIDFLVGNNFDFNKLFKEGISYLNKDEENRCLDILLDKQKLRATQNTTVKSNTNPISVPEEDKEFIDKNIELIDEFIKSDKKEISLPRCNGFLRKLMYQLVSERYESDISLETRIEENKDRILYVVKSSEEEKAEKDSKRCEQELIELKEAVGFSSVIQYIADSGKLIIGHNLLLDIIHIIDKFMTPVPYDYQEFKECLHCLFPRILDTKFMANSFPLKEVLPSSVLVHVFESVLKEPFTIPKIETDENDDCVYKLDDDKKYHEAGYDAFITGVSFLAMSQYLGKLKKSTQIILPESKLIKPFINKIHLMKIQDCSHIDLAGKDVVPSRDHVLHINFPREWKTTDLLEMFSPFGNIYIGWIDDCSAYIGLSSIDQANKALASLRNSKTCIVTTYAMHMAQLMLNTSIGHSPYASRKQDNKKRKLDSNDGQSPNKTERPTGDLQSKVDSKKRKLDSDESSTKSATDSGRKRKYEEKSTSNRKSSKVFLESSTWD